MGARAPGDDREDSRGQRSCDREDSMRSSNDDRASKPNRERQLAENEGDYPLPFFAWAEPGINPSRGH